MKVKIRISDTVLEDWDWPIDELTIEDGIVVGQKSVHEGAYAITDCVGWPVERLLKWTHYDGTGEHPEIFQEMWDRKKSKWDTFVKELPDE